MLVTAINNTYSTHLLINRWYWSQSTQQQLLDVITNTLEVITTILLLLSHCYTDFLGLIDNWLTLDYEPVVITVDCDNTVSWSDIRGWLMADMAYVEMWCGFLWSDCVNAATELYYRVRTIL